MAQRQEHAIDLTNDRGQIRLAGQAALIATPTRPSRALTDAELAQVAGGDGPPSGAGNDTGIATPILF
jgi:hypothetical protein